MTTQDRKRRVIEDAVARLSLVLGAVVGAVLTTISGESATIRGAVFVGVCVFVVFIVQMWSASTDSDAKSEGAS